jgi:hypothetical protein
MFLGIKYLGRDGRNKQFTVRKQEEVTFGSSRRADCVIDSESGISDIHFLVAFRDNDWQVAGYSGNSVKHNGHNVMRCVLGHGDRIIAGRAEFEIAIQSGLETVVPVPVDVPEEPAVEVEPERIEITNTSKGLISKAEVSSISELPRLIASMGELRNLYLLFNRKRFGVQETFGSNTVAQDLIERAPSEIRSTDSLELIAVEGSEESLPIVERILVGDSGVLLASSKNEADLKESMKLLWGWFLRPSVLNHHLVHGSEFLTTQLLSPVDTLMILPRSGAKWTFWGATEAQGQFLSEIAKANPLVDLR